MKLVCISNVIDGKSIERLVVGEQRRTVQEAG